MSPATIDYNSPELPKGLTREVVEKGTKATLEQLNAIGYKAEGYFIDSNTTDLSALAQQLKD
ncbi:hypothetical protein MKQ68_04825 [Chitinophaga horti]|uniref:Uncharacterized protein n=1 Tax=Chitinophaga horti TaxID=2920382 RepID=A0ABY6J4X6_9BACT|nr:hypothetical protein [Chitinophaga horti]UYQ94411.1 hypothetical protein MKQ68_04825 [Chitinophaga horti]